MVTKTNLEYDQVIKRLHLYYDMYLVSFGINDNSDLIIQFPVFVQTYSLSSLMLYQIKVVPVSIKVQNMHANSYTEIQISKPYISFNYEIYISLRHQELRSCKHIACDFYCEKLFFVKLKFKYSCDTAIFFFLIHSKTSLKNSCTFNHYFNNTSIMHVVLDGGNEIILANWLNKEISLRY